MIRFKPALFGNFCVATEEYISKIQDGMVLLYFNDIDKAMYWKNCHLVQLVTGDCHLVSKDFTSI